MATTVSAPRSDTVSDERRGGAPRRNPHSSGAAPWLFLAPYLVLFLTFVIAPIVYGLYISLHRYDFTLPNKPFVGLENYVDLFTPRSEEHTSEIQSRQYLVCRLLLDKKKHLCSHLLYMLLSFF